MFKIDTKGIAKLEADLEMFAKRSLPFATNNTINGAAVAAQRVARNIVSGKMTERNKFTKQSIQFQLSKTLRISQQEALTGSTAPYMEVQEFGGQKVKTGKHGVAIPTSEASGEGPAAFPRKRMVRRANKLNNIRMANRQGQGGRKQRNRVAVQMAAESGRRFVFLELGRRTGIYRVMGGKRNPKLRKMYDLTKPSVAIPARPWLAPSVAKSEKGMPAMYKKSLEFQARKHGLFK